MFRSATERAWPSFETDTVRLARPLFANQEGVFGKVQFKLYVRVLHPMAVKYGVALKESRRRVREKPSLARVLAIAFAGAFAAFFLGFIYFLNQVQAAGRARSVSADAIVVFSGEPKRIEVATRLLAGGSARRLVIVGQDNGDDIAEMRAANKTLFACCVKIDQRSVNTSEDAKLANNLLKSAPVRSLILVTSSFHMPRARRELNRQAPEMQIIPYGVADDFYRISNIPRSPEVASAFLSQYVLYVSSWIPGSRNVWDESNAREILGAVTNLRNLALVLLAVLAVMIGAYAFSRHRDRYR